MKDRVKYNSDISSNEIYLTMLVCSFIGFESVAGTVITAMRTLIILPYKLDTILINGILFFLALESIKLIFKRIRPMDFGLLLFFITAMVISIICNGEYDYFIELGTRFVIGAVPCYLVSRCVRNYELTIRYMNITSLLITISQFLLLFVLNAGDIKGYSQYSAYLLLPAAIISANNSFRDKNIIHIVNFVLAVFLIFAAGARGPLICIVLFIGLKVVIIARKSVKNITLTTIITTCILTGVKYFSTDILNYMRTVMVRQNLSIRVIDRLLANEFMQDYSRTSIAGYALQVIKNNPILGVGLGIDRVMISSWMGQPETDIVGWYPHNIALELWMQFGLILGTILIFSIIILFLKAIFGARDNSEQDVACIFAAIGLFPLFFSDSYISSGLFFCAIAICLNICQSPVNTPVKRR